MRNPKLPTARRSDFQRFIPVSLNSFVHSHRHEQGFRLDLLHFSEDVEEAEAVFSPRNCHGDFVVEVEHAVLGCCRSDLGFDGFGEAFFAEVLSRVGSGEEGFSAFASCA